jgi:hypothetical protein
VARINRGESVLAAQERNVTVTGSNETIEKCINACRSLDSGNREDTIINKVKKCIVEHNIWYSVIDNNGNKGWISRHFLKTAE